MVSPAVAAAAPCRKRRRFGRAVSAGRAAKAVERAMGSAFRSAGCLMDGSADADIGGTATDVAVHGAADVVVIRLGVAGQQRRRRHDLAGLAVAALDHIELAPGGL